MLGTLEAVYIYKIASNKIKLCKHRINKKAMCFRRI